MMELTPAQRAIRRRNRNMLVGLFVLFFGGMLVAGLLRFSGWRPEGSKNKGELLQPYGDLRAYTPTLYHQKCSAVFEHVYESYPERDAGVYAQAA